MLFLPKRLIRCAVEDRLVAAVIEALIERISRDQVVMAASEGVPYLHFQ